MEAIGIRVDTEVAWRTRLRDGILIQERTCPRCAIRRTARLGQGTSFCFNCRLKWPTRAAPVAQRVGTPLPHQMLGPADLARMAVYRAAVRAGFNSDWPVAHAASGQNRSG
jgi:ribosomal protein L37AE/L43A